MSFWASTLAKYTQIAGISSFFLNNSEVEAYKLYLSRNELNEVIKQKLLSLIWSVHNSKYGLNIRL